MKKLGSLLTRLFRWIVRQIWRLVKWIWSISFRLVRFVISLAWDVWRNFLWPLVVNACKMLRSCYINTLKPLAFAYHGKAKHYHDTVALPLAKIHYQQSKEHYFSVLHPRLISYGQRAKAHYEQHHAARVERAKSKLDVWLRTFQKIDPEVEFYPAVLEVLETPPSPLGRTIMHVISGFVLFAFLWACIGTVDIIATAQGKIVPTSRSKVIQPLESGVVRNIHVQDGQQVHAGDVLLEIDSTITESERDRLHNDYVDASLDVARLKALTSGSDDPVTVFNPPSDASRAQLETHKALLANQFSEYHAKVTSLDQQIAQNEGNRDAVSATIDKLTQSMPLLEERTKVREELSKKGYGTKIDTLTAQQDLVEHQKELQVQQARLVEATGALESLREQRKQAEAEFQHTNLDKLAEAEQKAASLHEQLLQAAQKYRLQTLTSPVDGTVQQLAIHTEGGVVTPAQTLMVVVPADSHLEIEAMVSNRDIGFVHADEATEIKVDTFNFTRYGLLHGKVLSVSQDAIMRDKNTDSKDDKKQIGAENESSELAGQELVYAARISLDTTEMDIDGRKVKLAPGMAVTAEIKTGHRHIIGYLLSPLRRHMQQSLREQ